MSDLLVSLLALLEPPFSAEGYKLQRSDAVFRKTDKQGSFTAVAVFLDRASVKGFYKIAAHGQIRLNEVENVYAPFHPYLLPAERKKNVTIALNCDHLFADKALLRSVELTHETLPSVADAFWLALARDVLPILGLYGDRVRLYENLAQNDYTKRITSDPCARYSFLLSCAALDHDRVGFRRWQDEFLAYCQAPHAKCHLPLAQSLIDGISKSHFAP